MINWRHLLAEMYGTFFLTFGITISFGYPFAVGSALLIAIVSSGQISGAHFNPAVTTANIFYGILKKEITKDYLFVYLTYYVAQIIGGILGPLLAWGVHGRTWKMIVHDDFSTGQAFVMEMIITTLLCLTAMIHREIERYGLMGPLVISLVLFVGAFISGDISDGCFNPALGLGANLTDQWNNGGDGHRFKYLWIYILAPLLGGLIAAVLYFILIEDVREQFYSKALRTASVVDEEYMRASVADN